MSFKQKKTQLAAVLLPISLLASTVAYANDNSRITALEEEVALLKSEQSSQDWTDKVSINGFASVGFGVADNDAGYLGYSKDNSFKTDSVFALQTSFAFNENTEATVQLIAEGKEDWDPRFEWAFISHHISENLTVRGGKLRLPTYMLSDYLDVGYAYPFARPNGEVYGGPLSAYSGIDFIYTADFSDITWTIQPFAGEADYTEGTYLKDMWGAVNQLDWEEFSFRVSYLDTKVAIEAYNLEIDASFTGLGFTYDNDSLLVMVESTRTKTEGSSKDTTAGYVAVAYRFDEFQPYVSISRRETASDERSGYTAGLRWDFADNLAVKFDISTAHDLDNTAGGLAGNITNAEGVLPYDDSRVTSIIFDAIF